MRMLFLFTWLFAAYRCGDLPSWDPLARALDDTNKLQDIVDKQTTNAKEFINDQSNRLEDFFKTSKTKVNEAFDSTYNNARLMKVAMDNYIHEQRQVISDGLKKMSDTIRDKRNAVEATVSYVPTQYTASNHIVKPEMLLSVPSVIAKNGYLIETHTIISKGYILNVHRIPRSKNDSDTSSKTVYLQHGIFASSADWILNGPEKGLAYVLADAGYDVWMGNIRGNKYSREHLWLNTNSKEFWDFSWHDVAMHDVPAILDYIKSVKGATTKITYIGHSMGTTILFAMLSLRPEYNKILEAGIALAPVVYMSDIKSPLKSLAPIASNVAYMEMLYGSHEFLPKNSALGKLSTACDVDNSDYGLCKNVIFYICGADDEQINEALLPTFISNLGTGTSWKTTVHFAQQIVDGDEFSLFDYGPYYNIIKYGSPRAPAYDLSKVTLPITLFWAQNDLLSSEKDVMKLYKKLPNYTEMYMVPHPKFNHLDYLWAVDAKNLINNKILNKLAKVFETDWRELLLKFNFRY